MKNLFSKPIQFIKSHPKTDIAILLTGLAIFGVITFLNAGRASIWFDEAFSSYIIQFSYLDIALFTATDVHPPLYYWFLKTWSLLFGMSEIALRSLSILFGAGAITAAYVLARKFFGRTVAATSLLFLIVSPMLIRYSDEARMYTLAACIVLLATYVLARVTETKSKKLWVLYGVLVSLGMWTHYFTALAWIAHWIWRAIIIRNRGDSFKVFWKKFFTKDWVLTHVLAVGLFLPWLIFMVRQLTVVQAAGFWIGPVSVNTVTNYFTNYFYYLEYGNVTGWLALLIIAVLTTVIVLLPKVYRSFTADGKRNFLLVTVLTWAPPVLLFLASLPPLRSSFVERYLVPAIVALSIFLAVVLVVGTRRWKPLLRALPILAITGMMIFGIFNVYAYGNYNKNSNVHITTRQLVSEIRAQAEPGQPIVADSPWTFYEMIPYTSDENPILFIDENTEYIYGSLDMLKNRDQHKITDLEQFKKDNPVIWYASYTESDDVAAYQDSWTKIKTVSYNDPLTGKDLYKATQYRVSGE